jgi:ribonuclease HI
MKVEIYTDGACSNNGKQDAQAAWAFYLPEHKSVSNAGKVPEEEPQTNQRGELMAISEAVKAAEIAFPLLETDLKIYTDSTYSKNCLTTWITAWVRNNWRTSQGGDVMHKDLIEATSNRLSKFKSFNITYVKAHTGGIDEQSRNNHIVDRMAVDVLNPKQQEDKKIEPSKDVFEGCPLKMMGPPIEEVQLINWCFENMGQLDTVELRKAMISVLSKTLKKKGYEVEKQRLHRSNLYRLKTESGLIKTEVKVTKEE